jgi:hypothetical protein
MHHDDGVNIGYAIHAGMVVVADDSDDTAERFEAAQCGPRDGRRAPRGRRLREGDSVRQGARHRPAVGAVRTEGSVRGSGPA